MKKNDELSSIELQRILLACCNITVSGTCYRVLSGTRYRVLVQKALLLVQKALLATSSSKNLLGLADLCLLFQLFSWHKNCLIPCLTDK